MLYQTTDSQIGLKVPVYPYFHSLKAFTFTDSAEITQCELTLYLFT